METDFINVLAAEGPLHIAEIPKQCVELYSWTEPLEWWSLCFTRGSTLNQNSHVTTEFCAECYSKWEDAKRIRNVTKKLVEA